MSGGDLAQPVAFSSAAILGRLGDTRMNVASNQAKAEQVADATLETGGYRECGCSPALIPDMNF